MYVGELQSYSESEIFPSCRGSRFVFMLCPFNKARAPVLPAPPNARKRHWKNLTGGIAAPERGFSVGGSPERRSPLLARSPPVPAAVA